VLAHVVEREEALLLDRLDDGAFAHAIAAADLHRVGHRGGLVLPLVAAVAQMRLAEHQVVADFVDVLLVAQQLKIVRAVDRVAIQHAADHAVVAQYEPLVHAADGVVQHDLLGVRAARKIAGGKKIDARHFELRRQHRTLVAADAEMREMIRAYFRHVEERRDEAVRDTAMGDALADRVNFRIVGLHRVADDDAAVAVKPGRLG
jgi:hypothetical protein